MYTLASPPHLPRGLHHTHNPTTLCRVLAARHSGAVVAPIAESERVLGSPSPATSSDAFVSSTDPLVLPKSTKNAILDPALRSTWSHRAWVIAGFASILTALTKSVLAAADSGAVVEPVIASILGYLLADLGSGFYHFAIDNYGSPSTQIFGSQIEAFRGHHRRPTTILRRQPANNLHALARAVAFSVVPLEFAIGSGGTGATTAAVQAFIGVCAGGIMLSQQFHAWAHGVKGRVPKLVELMQDAGVLISRDMHGAHHRVPYNNSYCIVSGLWNKVLDEHRVFEIVEMVVFFKFGVRPRSWEETSIEWREERS